MFILSNQFTVFIMLRYTYRSYGAPHHRVAAVEHIFCIHIMAMPMPMPMLWNRAVRFAEKRRLMIQEHN